MQLNGNQASVRSDAMAAQLGSGAGREIDLYEELLAFVEMTPDEQWRYLHPVAPAAAKETAETVVVEVGEPDSPDSVQHAAELTPEPGVVDALFDPAEESGREIVDVFENCEPLDDLNPDLNPNLSMATDLAGSGEIVEMFGTAELLADLCPDTDLDTDLNTDLAGTRSGTIDMFETTGPFVDLGRRDLAGSTSRMTCPACKAELVTDDLFCAECGSFLNGIPSAATSTQACADCSQDVSIDEVFCPWCGSVLAFS